MLKCQMCAAPLPVPEGRSRPRRYCSPACKQRAYRQRELIPAEMRRADRWVRWRKVPRNGRVTKQPIQCDGRPASSTDAGTWSPYAAVKRSKVGSGLGFALGAGVGCIDLDHCIEDGRVLPWAQRILDVAPATYIEVSQSGEGIHIFGLLDEGPGRNRRRDGVNVEVYSVGRYIAVTGDKHPSSGARLAPIGGLVEQLI